MEQNQFKVIYTGQVKDGFDAAEVSQAFAKKFKLPLSKATKIIQAGREVTIKARAEHVKAYQLKSLLESLGMIVRLERAPIQAPKVKPESTATDTKVMNTETGQSGAWSLEPMESEKAEDDVETEEGQLSKNQAGQEQVEKPAFTDLSRPTVVLEKPAENKSPEPKFTKDDKPESVQRDNSTSLMSLLRGAGAWVFAGLGILIILVKKFGLFKLLKLGGLATAAAFAGYQPDEICMGNERCEAAVEDQIDDCWERAGLDDYDIDAMSDEDYFALKPKLEEDFVACFRYEDNDERVFLSPLDLRLDLIDNCTFTENAQCESLAEGQLKACYDRHQIGYLVSASTTDFYQEVADHASVFKSYYGCYKDESGEVLFSDVLAGWDELY